LLTKWHAQPLAQAALKGLRTRYADAVNMAPDVDHYILASVTHPFFKSDGFHAFMKPELTNCSLTHTPHLLETRPLKRQLLENPKMGVIQMTIFTNLNVIQQLQLIMPH
jgi:hypothetical protein